MFHVPNMRVYGAVWLASFVLASLLAGTVHGAERAFEQQRQAAAHGSVEISNVAGHIDVSGWDKAEVSVSGSLDDNVDHVELSGGDDHIRIKVIPRSGHFSWGSGNGTRLKVQLPRGSALSATLVSSQFKVTGVEGDLNVQSVSGDIEGEAGGDVRIGTVSGAIHVGARHAKRMEVSSVSGDIVLTGGDGEANVNTVSGDATLSAGTLSRARFKTVSGDLQATLGLEADARIEAESVSGSLRFDIRGTPGVDYDAQSMTGGIENCFGPKPVKAEYGPGARLMFKSGAGGARVRLGTQSGDIRLCTSA